MEYEISSVQDCCKSLIRKLVLGVYFDTNEQIEQIFDKRLTLWVQLNEIESRKCSLLRV